MALDGEAPDLAEQSQSGLTPRSWAFEAGDRKNEMTSIITRDLSPTDSEDLAVYYSPIEISAHKSSGQ
jgi:cytochrome c553